MDPIINDILTLIDDVAHDLRADPPASAAGLLWKLVDAAGLLASRVARPTCGLSDSPTARGFYIAADTAAYGAWLYIARPQ